MRAMICSAYGGLDDLTWGELPDPEPGPGEVLVEVSAIGVNYPDMLLISGLYQARPPTPFAPGFEVAGRVARVGEGVTNVAVGDRVMAYVEHGGYAEQVVAPAISTFPAPAALTDAEAACLPVAWGTAYHALVDRCRLQRGETLVVLGAAGGVGTAAIQVGARLGAEVIACVSSDAKAEFARSQGASEVIRYDQQELKTAIRERTGGRGADLVFDPVGGDATEAALRALAWEGRLAVIGFVSGIPSVPTNLVLLRSSALLGVFWGAFSARFPDHNRANFEVLTRWTEEGAVRPPVTATFPLPEARSALQLLANREALGRVALVVE